MKTTPEAPVVEAPETPSLQPQKPLLAGDLSAKLGALFAPETAAPPAPSEEGEPEAPKKKETAEPPKKTETPTKSEAPAVVAPEKEGEETEDAPVTLDLLLDVEDASLVIADDDEIPAFVKSEGEQAITTWKGLKQAEKAARTEAAELKAKLEALQSATPEETTKELETLRARVAEQENALLAVKVEESQEYRTTVTEPLQQIEQEILALTVTPEVAKSVFDGMMTADLRARAEMISDALADLPPMAQTHIYALVKDYDKIMAHREVIRQKAAEAKAEIERSSLEKQTVETAEQKRLREAATTKIWENLTKTLPFMLNDDGEVLPEYATALAKAKEGDITRAGLATQAFAPIAIHLVPQLAEMLKKKEGEIAKLNKQVNLLTGSSPSSAPKKDTSAGDPAPKQLPKGGLAELLVKRLSDQGIAS